MYNVQIIVRLSPAIPRVVQSHKFWTPIGSITFLVDFPGSPPHSEFQPLWSHRELGSWLVGPQIIIVWPVQSLI